MGMDSRPIFSDEVVEFFSRLPRRRQRRLLDRARELAADPTLVPDYWTTDSDGRDICHLMVGDFIFTYWIDHAVKHVVTTEIDDAE